MIFCSTRFEVFKMVIPNFILFRSILVAGLAKNALGTYIFEECIKPNPLQNAKYCAGQQALNFLTYLDTTDSYGVTEGVSIDKNDSAMSRVINEDFSDIDPSNIRYYITKLNLL